MAEPLWRRLSPGDDPVVEQFLASQIEVAHRDLARANEWHRSGRRYEFDPPLPRGSSSAMFQIEQVEMRSVGRRDAGRMLWALSTGLAAAAAVALLAWSTVAPLSALIPA